MKCIICGKEIGYSEKEILECDRCWYIKLHIKKDPVRAQKILDYLNSEIGMKNETKNHL